MPPYVSPKDLRGLRQDFIPDADFILPICTNRERFFLMLQALQYFRSRTEDHQNLDQLIDFLEAWAYVGNPQDSPCFPDVDTEREQNECIEFPTDATILSYAPQNPFTQPDYIPPGYIAVPFIVVTEGSPLALVGFKIGDVISGYLSPPILTPALGEGVARIRVSFDGIGKAELHLIKIPSGGMALITHDDNPLTAQFITLNLDVVQLPPETENIDIVEIDFDTPGRHHIDISFLARFNDEITFLTYGGGLRKVVLCGFDQTIDEQAHERARKGAFGIDEGQPMAIRVDPDRCYMLQFECSPGQWVDLLDTRCGAQEQQRQPTDGTALADGECRSWDVALKGNERWLLPISVQEGDVITVTDASGAWSDGTPQWNCVDGRIYILGGCTTDDASDMGDPLATVNHMRLLLSIDGTFYDGYNTVTGVGSGISDAAVEFQANDGTLSDNSGAITFHVEVCRAAAVPETFAISYDAGAGLTTVTQGQVFAITDSVATGGHYNIQFHVSPCAKLTILSTSGWSSMAGGTDVNFNVIDCASASHPRIVSGGEIPTSVVSEECTICGINSATPFSITVMVEPV